METKGFNENEILGHDEEALQSETWHMAREALKTEVQHFTEAPEIRHFAVEKVRQNDNVYGVVWGNVVREYLKTAYSEKKTQADVVSDGITYKVLKRKEVTVFYDADGNTLFDVENKRLEKEYGYVIQEEKPEAKSENDVSNDNVEQPNPDAVKRIAKEKLEKELKADKNKAFAEPVIGHLLKRCEDDLGVAQDVVQEHKTWKKCFDYICAQARKQAVEGVTAACDNAVYEWAEDYYHKDDKAEEEKKAKEAAEQKKKQKERAEMAKSTPNKKEAAKPKEEPKKKSKEMDGQLDMFSMMGM